MLQLLKKRATEPVPVPQSSLARRTKEEKKNTIQPCMKLGRGKQKKWLS
jgi:hypothetical protein